MALEFTGERYVPELSAGKISYEHWHRYIFAKNWCQGKKVLDIACGEGYGSNYLSQFALNIVGIDIDKNAITHAKDVYKNSNINFIESSATQLPIEDVSIDVVVCFETIEHLGSDDQQNFMKEINRVLKQDGILLISTPNKKVYSDDATYTNPFHINEFYEKEFRCFLKQFFNEIDIFYQQIICGSMIQQKQPQCLTTEYIHFSENGFVPGMSVNHTATEYLLAVCSNIVNQAVDGINKSCLLIDEDNSLYKEKFI